MKRDYEQIARQFEEDVLSGRVLVRRFVKNAVLRNVRDKERWSKSGPFTYSISKGARACSFVEQKLFAKGMPGELPPGWVWMLFTLFGWRRRSDGRRRFKKFYL